MTGWTGCCLAGDCRRRYSIRIVSRGRVVWCLQSWNSCYMIRQRCSQFKPVSGKLTQRWYLIRWIDKCLEVFSNNLSYHSHNTLFSTTIIGHFQSLIIIASCDVPTDCGRSSLLIKTWSSNTIKRDAVETLPTSRSPQPTGNQTLHPHSSLFTHYYNAISSYKGTSPKALKLSI
jgi:hypothetical protein